MGQFPTEHQTNHRQRYKCLVVLQITLIYCLSLLKGLRQQTHKFYKRTKHRVMRSTPIRQLKLSILAITEYRVIVNMLHVYIICKKNSSYLNQ